MLKNGLYLAQCLGLADSLLDNLWREIHNYFPVLDHLFDKTRAHHLAPIGYGIIESKSGNGWYLCFISNTHPRQGGLAPVYPLSMAVLPGLADDRFGRPHKGKMQI